MYQSEDMESMRGVSVARSHSDSKKRKITPSDSSFGLAEKIDEDRAKVRHTYLCKKTFFLNQNLLNVFFYQVFIGMCTFPAFYVMTKFIIMMVIRSDSFILSSIFVIIIINMISHFAFTKICCKPDRLN